MKKKALAVAAAVCAAGMLLSGCGGSGSGGSTAAEGNVMKVYGCEPQHPLIPTNTNETCGGNPLSLLFANLVAFDAKGNAKNEVAQSIEPNADNTEYTIKLKSGWKFTDGTPVTAESFTKAWSYGANAANAQVSSSFFNVIKGFEDLQKDGLKGDEQLSGLQVVDDTTFTVQLNAPSSTFPIMVGYNAYAPLPESFYKDPKAFGNNPVGNGTYKFESWTHNQSIKLVKNTNYKGSFPTKNDGITFQMYTDPQPAYADVQAGNLDAMETVPSSASKTFQTDSQVQAINEAGSVFQSFTFPSTMEHFKLDEEGRLRRQAISMAINRQQIIDKLYNGQGTAAVDWTAPIIPGYSADLPGNEVLKYNADKAKELWEQANAINPWKDTDEFQVAYNSDSGGKDVYDAITNSIKNALGIKASSVAYPTFSEFRNTVLKREMKIAFRTGWQPDYPSPESYLVSLYDSSAADGNGSNDGDYKNPEFDALMDQAAQAPDEDAANKLYQQGEELLFKDMPAVPLWYSNNKGVAALGVKGFAITWQGIPDYRELTR